MGRSNRPTGLDTPDDSSCEYQVSYRSLHGRLLIRDFHFGCPGTGRCYTHARRFQRVFPSPTVLYPVFRREPNHRPCRTNTDEKIARCPKPSDARQLDVWTKVKFGSEFGYLRILTWNPRVPPWPAPSSRGSGRSGRPARDKISLHPYFTHPHFSHPP